MYLTATLKLRANDHDRRRLRIALSRWSAAIEEALDRARSRQRDLLRCIRIWRSPGGSREQLVVDSKQLEKVVEECVRATCPRLHSSVPRSMFAALERCLAAWLGQYIIWIESERSAPKPGFPVLPPATAGAAEARHALALEASRSVITLSEEASWRAEVLRSARSRLLPMSFRAVIGGGEHGLIYCGLLRRDDGRYYALLTLWPQRDPLGEPVRRARNRQQTGVVRNVRSTLPFGPTDRARSTMIIPLQMGRGHQRVFFTRATPKTAELVRKGEEFYLHVAFEFPDQGGRPLSGNVLAIRRGVGTLVSVVMIDPHGTVLHREAISGRELVRLVTAIGRVRAIRQRKGQPLAGDRRASRVAEHHLYSAGHQIIDLACRYGAAIVILRDSRARKPQRFLRWKHFRRLTEILTQLAAEAGLPAPEERPVYGSWSTCVTCGWCPGMRVRHENIGPEQCPGCATVRDPEYHLAQLLALDALRLRVATAERPPLGDFIQTRGTGV
jgi:hypothetical protein